MHSTNVEKSENYLQSACYHISIAVDITCSIECVKLRDQNINFTRLQIHESTAIIIFINRIQPSVKTTGARRSCKAPNGLQKTTSLFNAYHLLARYRQGFGVCFEVRKYTRDAQQI